MYWTPWIRGKEEREMFERDGILFRSGLLGGVPGILAGFSCREGGVSALPHTAALNLTDGLGDDAETVRRNMEIFARSVSRGRYGGEAAVKARQIHSAKIRAVGPENAGEGTLREAGEDCDGFVTDAPGVMPVIRVADCAPVLLAGRKEDGRPVIAAVHAGWRGTVGGIAGEAVRLLLRYGCAAESIRAAVGAHIGFCCYEVGEDFAAAVAEARGAAFAARHIRVPGGAEKPHADLTGMNREILLDAGLTEAQIDVSPDCTMCGTETYYSHRGMHGKRGTMGAGIVILPPPAGRGPEPIDG